MKQFPKLHILFVCIWFQLLEEALRRSWKSFQPNISSTSSSGELAWGGDKPVTVSQQTEARGTSQAAGRLDDSDSRPASPWDGWGGGDGGDTSETWLTFTGSQTLSCSICDRAGVIVLCLWTRFTLFSKQRSKRMIDGAERWVMARLRLGGWICVFKKNSLCSQSQTVHTFTDTQTASGLCLLHWGLDL